MWKVGTGVVRGGLWGILGCSGLPGALLMCYEGTGICTSVMDRLSSTCQFPWGRTNLSKHWASALTVFLQCVFTLCRCPVWARFLPYRNLLRWDLGNSLWQENLAKLTSWRELKYLKNPLKALLWALWPWEILRYWVIWGLATVMLNNDFSRLLVFRTVFVSTSEICVFVSHWAPWGIEFLSVMTDGVSIISVSFNQVIVLQNL